MNVGDFVRTPKGIGKVESIEIDKQDTIIHLDCGITIDYITKDFTEKEINNMYSSSPQIIDLIEVGDYVNGNKIIKISQDHYGRTILMYGYDDGERQVAITIYEEDIKTIVTHEQFESEAYRVEE